MSTDDGVVASGTLAGRKRRPLGFFAVVALVFFEVSGGPFGIEDSVRYGGPGLALLALLVLPVIWSVPEALVTAELGTMFPEDSGYVAWVTAAFGPFWGFQVGFMSWISGVIDNSIYPLFLARYLRWFFPILNHDLPVKVFLVVSSLGLTYLNYRGLKVVGRTAVVLTAFILCPFVVLTGMAAKDVDPSNWFAAADPETKDLVGFVNVMFWNLNYWDSVASLSGEIGDVASVLPVALIAAVVLVLVVYFVPVLVGVGRLGSSDWPDGFFSYLGKQVGGVWLEGWVTAAAVASSIGLFTAELSSDAYLVLGLAERGMLPKFLAQKSKYETPTVALLMSASGVVAVLISFSFESTVEMLNAAYCFAELVEFGALIRLRIALPEFPRPYKIPLSVPWLCCILVPSTLFALGIILAPFVTLDFGIMLFIGVVWVLSISLYYALEFSRERGLLKFNRLQLSSLVSSTYEHLPGQVLNGIDGDSSYETEMTPPP